MAALGKIRSKGIILISIIGFALFAFIAEEAFRSCESARNNQRSQVGEVLGNKLSVQDFQKLMDEYTEVVKLQQGTDNLTEDQLNSVKDAVWGTYLQTTIINDEAEKLGLTVTDTELQNIINKGTHPMLLQTPFVNQQTGRFDANQLKSFLAEYKKLAGSNAAETKQAEAIYKYWRFIEKTLRQQLLAQKYQSLLGHALLSNPIEAKMAYEAQINESSIQLVSFPYSSIEDAKITVSDDELKAKYKELKPLFNQVVETRNIKYINVPVLPSAADRKAIDAQFAQIKADLAEAADPTEVVRKSTSLQPYNGLAVLKTAFPQEIAQRIDSIGVGQVYGPFEVTRDNTLNLIKLVAKQQLPDSVEYRRISVGGNTIEEGRTRADSIYKALQAGADFEALAKTYGQTGVSTWLTTAQYQNATLDADSKQLIETLNTLGAGETRNLQFTQGNVIVQVLNRKALVEKYQVAVVKKTIDYSPETRTQIYNKFASFISANQKAEDIIENAAKSGYQVLTANDISTSQHNILNLRSTREALKWIFDAKEKQVSDMFECGNNGDHLLLVILDQINPVGYRDWSDAQVKEELKAEVLKDKKAAQLIEKLKGVNNIAAAQQKGGKLSTVEQITFANPVFVGETGASEPVLSGAVSATAKGKFSGQPVKGNGGVYVFQVTGKTQLPTKFDAKQFETQTRQRVMQAAGQFMDELMIRAKVKDNRYLFF